MKMLHKPEHWNVVKKAPKPIRQNKSSPSKSNVIPFTSATTAPSELNGYPAKNDDSTLSKLTSNLELKETSYVESGTKTKNLELFSDVGTQSVDALWSQYNMPPAGYVQVDSEDVPDEDIFLIQRMWQDLLDLEAGLKLSIGEKDAYGLNADWHKQKVAEELKARGLGQPFQSKYFLQKLDFDTAILFAREDIANGFGANPNESRENLHLLQ